ncbi:MULTISPECIES: hypothetical protein [Pseudomonas]|uniref:Uncharacterized protein n=1 Tax=Pseudomonas lutea TaxID=243924 RepID=A0A9X8QLX5_9PSED|nr:MULTISPECIES: hypothetical protein [Pseudomonas]SER43531.1 hypothetical protein SAMN05216409_12114 [Pseudomonas lutea]
MKAYWAPKSVPEALQPVLAVELASSQKITPSLHRMLMEDKLLELFKEAGSEAKGILQMLVEHASELYSISQYVNPEHWPIAVLNSDSMTSILDKIDWMQELQGSPIPSDQVQAMLAEQSLWSLLEYV